MDRWLEEPLTRVSVRDVAPDPANSIAMSRAQVYCYGWEGNFSKKGMNDVLASNQWECMDTPCL